MQQPQWLRKFKNLINCNVHAHNLRENFEILLVQIHGGALLECWSTVSLLRRTLKHFFRPSSIRVWPEYSGHLGVILAHLCGPPMRRAMEHSLPQLTIVSHRLSMKTLEWSTCSLTLQDQDWYMCVVSHWMGNTHNYVHVVALSCCSNGRLFSTILTQQAIYWNVQS